jgi:hypothetical protein
VSDDADLRDLRLCALEAEPVAFGSTLKRELHFEEWVWRVAEELIGDVVLCRDRDATSDFTRQRALNHLATTSTTVTSANSLRDYAAACSCGFEVLVRFGARMTYLVWSCSPVGCLYGFGGARSGLVGWMGCGPA